MFPYILNREDCVRIDPAAGQVILATECERTTLTIMEFEPGVVTPEHSHPHEQVGYMIEGEAEFVIDGTHYPVRAGQMWRLPGGVPHQVKVGDRPMRVVEVFCPVREDFRAKED
ncbi:MAG TPA: cupin domain-containing protein [Thermoguttaceae bacterium]|nr:cupin domain-containing protein [Thermoguttaceae bacterium]